MPRYATLAPPSSYQTVTSEPTSLDSTTPRKSIGFFAERELPAGATVLVEKAAFAVLDAEARRAWPDSLTDERGLDNVALGREVGAERIGMFTPLALLDKRQKDS